MIYHVPVTKRSLVSPDLSDILSSESISEIAFFQEVT